MRTARPARAHCRRRDQPRRRRHRLHRCPRCQLRRRHWDTARKVDITGVTISNELDSPLADAAWTGHRLAAATQALPNGHCALPIQKACPHANACLTCPMFLTTATHLPAHREHRAQVIELITRAQADGRTRVAQMNQAVLSNLTSIITALEHPQDPDES